MGYSLSWIAVRGKTVKDIHSDLGLIGTGRTEEIAESPFNGASLRGGWYVVVADHYPAFSDALLGKLSISCDVIMCFVEEHVMYSAASQWKDSRNVWRIDHDGGSIGVQHLKCTGELPPAFTSIRDRLFERQKTDTSTWKGHGTDHIFDIPLELAFELTGYRHDEDMDIEELYEILEEVTSPAKDQSLIRRLFGR